MLGYMHDLHPRQEAQRPDHEGRAEVGDLMRAVVRLAGLLAMLAEDLLIRAVDDEMPADLQRTLPLVKDAHRLLGREVFEQMRREDEVETSIRNQ